MCQLIAADASTAASTDAVLNQHLKRRRNQKATGVEEVLNYPNFRISASGLSWWHNVQNNKYVTSKTLPWHWSQLVLGPYQATSPSQKGSTSRQVQVDLLATRRKRGLKKDPGVFCLSTWWLWGEGGVLSFDMAALRRRSCFVFWHQPIFEGKAGLNVWGLPLWF